MRNCDGMKPCLQLNFCCGCDEPLRSLTDATAHSRVQGHIVTFTGSLTLKEETAADAEPLHHFVELGFVCGCGFVSTSLEKAREHIQKTKHIIKVFGRIRPKPSLKEKPSGGSPNLKGLHTCPPPAPVGGWDGDRGT